jgi:pantoate--beta-alanine ligase
VLTEVLKLLNLARSKRAYFGEKDHQQLSLIEGMARAFFLETEIIAVPTVREESGLALSSRNRRLSPSELSLAPLLYQALKNSPSASIAREMLEGSGFKVEYLEDLVRNGRARRYAAAWLGETRLIDNVEL